MDRHLVGGECPYYGCIPTKMMIRASRRARRGRPGLAVSPATPTVTPSWAPVAQRLDEEATTGWDDTIAVDRLQDAGATVHHGVGPPRRRRAGSRSSWPTAAPSTYAARRGVVLNTGTRPAAPPIDGLAGTPYWTNRDAVRATELPVVAGGDRRRPDRLRAGAGLRPLRRPGDGRAARRPRLLPADEPEAAELLGGGLRRGGHPGADRRRDDRACRSRRRRVHARRSATASELVADQLLVAAGPHPEPRRPRPGDRRASTRRARTVDGRRADARGGEALGDRRHHRPRRVHARLDVPVGDRAARHPRRGRPAGELPRGAAHDVHRSRGRRGRADRAAGPRRRAARPGRPRRRWSSPRAASPTAPVRAGWSRWWRMPTAECWSERRRWARPAARSSASWPSRSMPEVPTVDAVER